MGTKVDAPRQALLFILAGVFLSLAACSNEPSLVAIRETGGYCLHETCFDQNGQLICFAQENYLYADGTRKGGKKNYYYGPNACGDIPESCWHDSEDVWRCGKSGTTGEIVQP
jgi:hypothetical protein